MLRSFFLSLLLTVIVCAQVPIGATKQEVIDLVGWPASTSANANREILNYPDFTVVLENGLMAKLQFKPGKHKPLSSYLVTPRPAPVPQPTPSARTANSFQTTTPRETAGISNQKPEISSQSRLRSDATNPTSQTSNPPPPPRVSTRNTITDAFLTIAFQHKVLFTVIVLLFVASVLLQLSPRKSGRKRRREVDELFPRPPRKAQSEPPPLIIPRREERAKPDPLKDGWSLAHLREIEWHRFEHVVAAYERELGNNAELTDFGPDGGIDVLVFEKESRTPKRVIQCKAHGAQIGVDPIRSFLGAVAVQKVPQRAFYTTSTFTEPALVEFKNEANIELVDGPTFLNRIQRLHETARIRLFEIATEGDYTTPTCTNCGIKMVIRTVKTGRNAGNDFWACPTYRCGQIINIRRS